QPIDGLAALVLAARHLATGVAQPGDGGAHGVRQPSKALPDVGDRSALGSLEHADQHCPLRARSRRVEACQMVAPTFSAFVIARPPDRLAESVGAGNDEIPCSLRPAISSGVRIRLGILGCDVVRNTRRAVAVMPRVLAISRKAGPITISLGFCC